MAGAKELAVLLGVTGAVFLWADHGRGQSPEPTPAEHMERVRQMNEVAAQKLAADLQAGLDESARLSHSDPTQASALIRKLLATVGDDPSITESQRASWVRLLNARLRRLEIQAARSQRNVSDTEASSARRPRTDDSDGDLRQVREALLEIQQLQRDGHTAEARRQAEELAGRYPEIAAVQAARRTLAAADLLSNMRGERTESERRLAAIARDTNRSATPAATEVEFPRDWSEKTKNRSSLTQFTPKERAILHALNSIITVNFKNARFQEVIDWIKKETGQNILLDQDALQEAQVNYDTPVSVQGQGMAVRTVLRKVLGELGLSYVIKDQTLQVTSAVKAKELMVVRSYYIGDILGQAGVGSLLALPNAIKDNGQILINQQAKQIIELIQTSVEPQSWQANGGSGTIIFHPPSASLVIRQSAEVHAMLAGGMLR